MPKVEFELTDPKITQKQADRMTASLELDLIAYFNVLQDEILKTISKHDGSPEELIKEIDILLAPSYDIPEVKKTFLKKELLRNIKKWIKVRNEN